MDRITAWIKQYREQLSYLFFGGVTTGVNFVVYLALHTALGMNSDAANLIALLTAIAVAYVTNRKWVFQSHTRGAAMLRELGAFLSGRALTGLLDMGIMHVAVEVLGPRLFPGTGRALWDAGAKIASNVLVIILNYIFSKLFIFRKEK